MITERTSGVSNEDESRCVRYERGDDEPPSVVAAKALADFRGEDVIASNVRLYDYVDPEALDALFARTNRGGDRTTGEVRFDVEGATVVVRPGSVRVY